jgi:hypothetical protein
MIVGCRSCPRAIITLGDVEKHALGRDEGGVRGRNLGESCRSVLKDDCAIRITENNCVVELIQNGSEHGNLFGKHAGIARVGGHGSWDVLPRWRGCGENFAGDLKHFALKKLLHERQWKAQLIHFQT